MSVETITILLFVSTLSLLITGLPLAFTLGGVSLFFTIFFWGPDKLYILALSGYSSLQDVNLVAIPLYIFMGWILEKSGIADEIFEAIHVWMGGFRGGLAVAALIISSIWGAISGDIISAIFSMTAISFAPLMRRGYNKQLAIGCINLGGVLAFLIPPSLITIVFCSVTGLSIGRMYLGAFIPSLIVVGLSILYITVRCWLRPADGPATPPESRVDLKTKVTKLKGIIAPVVLILIILVGIYTGAYTPMEASAIGAVGALIIGLLKRSLTWRSLWEVLSSTLAATCMIGWVFISIGAFDAVYQGIGASDLARNIAASIPGGGIPVVIITQLVLIMFGMIMDDLAIVMIFGPIFISIIKSLGFDPLWYGVLFMMNLQVALLSPPYGFGLFVMKSAIENLKQGFEIRLGEVVISAVPFIIILIISMIIVMLFPQTVIFLPSLLI
jgi:tripartite ATP-independent transporter DctM subunit